MFVPFLIVVGMIGVFAAHNEGGFECMQTEGAKPCIERAIEQAEPVDYSKMND